MKEQLERRITELEETFRKEIKAIREELKEPEYKVPAWYKFHNSEIGETVIFRAVTQDADWLHPEYPEGYVKGYHKRFCTPATSEEIERHLKKVCEKYKGDMIIDSSNINPCWNSHQYVTFHGDFHYDWDYDEVRMSGVTVYKNGIFAKILPSLKKRPETKEEFKVMLTDCVDYMTENPFRVIESFLENYDI